tara:strand:- start:4383 stop:4694 length:312 start_codon:yes stop_codon:yes gene_type:complete
MLNLKLLAFSILILACESSASNSVIGTWSTGDWNMYHTATFTDSTVLFDNHIDTLFRYNYRMNSDSLFIDNGSLKVSYYFPTSDSLVISGLPNTNNPLRYVKN